MSRRFINSVISSGMILLSFSGFTAHAYQVHADTSADQCVVDTQADSAISEFWKHLDTWTADARISAIDQQDPGLGELIRQWTPGQSAEEIQNRLNALGQNDNFGMLLDLRDGQNTSLSESDPQASAKTRYTEDEARKAADAIGDDPAADAEAKLSEMAARGTALDKTRLEQFQAHREEYNQAQQEFHDQLLQCADELKKSRPVPTWIWVVGGLAVLAILATAARAFVNSRRPSRHYR
ncbi:hypothetical protein GP475_06190 [Corynebacterium poyangense]|uniref:Uncharacterized protein n=1 Tax=Corynebacterium poyangense TaxID=2684405 RepID=A0A7H0SNZ8_9CORY|nr:hypothetical protein [Corynebacterium poyangense]MBZ8177834.1 hypothetical protein [Corynebacterium poyangense]QNQ90273.1 hypothetical protein GP475_06190 [Corynebacterium poyangense]